MSDLYFGCSACGKCCDSAPQASIPELFHHQRRFVGCLSLRRVPKSDFSGRFFHALTHDSAHDVFLFASGFSLPSRARCPALGADQLCQIHHDRKPATCSVVPLDAALPDRLQHALLDARRRESRYLNADCISLEPRPTSTRITRRLELVDDAIRATLERRRRDLDDERRFWGQRVFELLGPELFDRPSEVARLPVDGVFTLSLTPALTVLAGASARCRERVLDYLEAQSELLSELILEALRERRAEDAGDLQQARAFLRSNDALRRVLAPGPPRAWTWSEIDAPELELWLGV